MLPHRRRADILETTLHRTRVHRQHMPGAARGFRFRDDALLPAAPAFRLFVRQQHLETHNSLGLESLNLSLGQKLKKATLFKKLTGGWMVRTRRRS